MSPEVIGKKILLKIKDGIIRFYDDDRPLVPHRETEEKGIWITDADITAQIHRRQKEKKPKYSRRKAKATW